MFVEKSFVINLDHRRDRLTSFYGRLPNEFLLGKPERWQAIQGDLVKHPDWWSAGNGAWGCYKSHLNILEHCLNNKIYSYAVFEDDAVFVDNFNSKLTDFMLNIPDWGMVYLGGQLLKEFNHPPQKVNDFVYIPYNVNRTHAFMLKGKETMEIVYKFLHAVPFEDTFHIDHHLGLLHERQQFPLFVPNKWLVGQYEGSSNISGNFNGTQFFSDPEYCYRTRMKPFASIGPAEL